MKSVKMIGVAMLVFMVCTAKASDPISLEKALKQKLVKFSAAGKGQVSGLNESSHYGKCMEVTLQNLTKRQFTITLENGRLLVPDDGGIQNMLITKKSSFIMQPFATAKKIVYAMCSESHDGSPGKGTKFSTTKMADSNLVQLAVFIDRNNFQDGDGQSAVWCVANKNSARSISCKDPVRTKLLQNFVAKLPGIPKNEAAVQSVSSRSQTNQTHKATFHFDFSLGYRTQVSLFLYDVNGNLVKAIIDNQWLNKGVYSKDYDISTTEAIDGTYTIQLIFDGQQIFKRPVVLGASAHETQEN